MDEPPYSMMLPLALWLSLLAHNTTSPPFVVIDFVVASEMSPVALINTSPNAAPAVVLRLPLTEILPPYTLMGPFTLNAWLIVNACVFSGLPNTKPLMVWPLAFKPNWLLLKDCPNAAVPSTPCTVTAPVVPTANAGVPVRLFRLMVTSDELVSKPVTPDFEPKVMGVVAA